MNRSRFPSSAFVSVRALNSFVGICRQMVLEVFVNLPEEASLLQGEPGSEPAAIAESPTGLPERGVDGAVR